MGNVCLQIFAHAAQNGVLQPLFYAFAAPCVSGGGGMVGAAAGILAGCSVFYEHVGGILAGIENGGIAQTQEFGVKGIFHGNCLNINVINNKTKLQNRENEEYFLLD
jgi:hypothetical protein